MIEAKQYHSKLNEWMSILVIVFEITITSIMSLNLYIDKNAIIPHPCGI